MRRSLLLTCLTAIYVAIVAAPTAIADEAEEAKVLADRFLRYQESNAPVAGRFTMRHKTEDKDWLLEFKTLAILKHSENGKYGIRFRPDNTLRICEWAWDGSREKSRTLEGSNVDETFFKTPEALLELMGEDNYNLYRPGRPNDPACYRPASCCFLAGTTPWRGRLKGCVFAIEPAPPGSPDGTIVLVATSFKDQESETLLNRDGKRLHGYPAVL